MFGSEKQVQKFFDLLMLAKNNTRIWENKGHTPDEMVKLFAGKRPQEPIIHQPKKVGRNGTCSCASGKKYKKCCALIENSGAAQLSHSERKLFYETLYKLFDFVNPKYNIFNSRIKPIYPAYHDERQLHKIREKLWVSPKVIGEFLNNTESF